MRIQEIKRVNHNRLEYSYTIEGAWSRYFEPSNPMWVEYQKSVEHVPDSIAVLPLIGNVIVLASLMDADIYVKEIDRDFYESIPKFLDGFDTIMPDHVHFKKQDIVHAEKIVDNPLSGTEQTENLLFFSGGVDATFSLVSHLEEKPALVTIWGADIPWDNEESWHQAIGFNQKVADRYGLSLLTIRSNFRRALQDDHINDYSMDLVQDWWWHAFHHGIAMMTLAAPLAYGMSKNLYFGSTFSSKDGKDWGSYVIASDPKIDNHVRFCGCQVKHDGYETTRYEKIQRICEFYDKQGEKAYLRVCFQSSVGENCGHCAKCARTILTILLQGSRPEDYGFQNWEEDFYVHFIAGMQETARSRVRFNFLSNYQYIQNAYREAYSIDEVPHLMRLFHQVDAPILWEFLHVPNNECIARDRAAKAYEEELYRQIGQFKYRLQVANQDAQSKTDQLSAANEAVSAANEELLRLREEKDSVLRAKCGLEEELNRVYESNSWKIMAPLRRVKKAVRNLKSVKTKLKNKIYYFGLKVIRRMIPEGCWKHDYVKWRWWFVCSDQYETRFKPMFEKMLKEYQGTIWNRGRIIKFDYWLCWIFLGAEPEDYFDFEFFWKGWAWRNHHITRQRLNFFVPILNDPEEKYILNNKIEFCTRWNHYLKRNWCVPQKVTLSEFQSLFGDVSRILVKPAGAFGGHGIYAIDLTPDNMESTYEQLHESTEEIIVEEFVRQKGFLNDVYPMALNPLRVTTIRIGDRIDVCYAFFTAGSQGKIIANDCSSGIVFSVNTETGELGLGQSRWGNGFVEHPESGVEVAGKRIPDWENIKAFCRDAHSHAPEGIGLIGWDVCWSAGEISLVEGNNGPGFPELPNKKEDQWKMMKNYLNCLEQKKVCDETTMNKGE